MPPTRREQLELDELLSDIYRGIETLPDKTRHAQINSNHYKAPDSTNANASNKSSNNLFSSRTYVKEYELPASSPLVRQHKQELATLRSNSGNSYSAASASPAATGGPKQPQRSTLKRHTNTPDQSRQPQSLASFVTSTTPENKRRVRIVDHPDKLAKGYNSSGDNDYYDDDHQPAEHELASETRRPTKVKYVNTNKLIYHQERNPDDNDGLSDDSEENENNSQLPDADDDDVDGATRVEYYHTTWLDRQLGRASKRRSSKELNERQVKEKAMIEELKRSLKNGAITLRQSFKGKHRNNNKGKPSETFDDQILSSSPSRPKESSVFGSGLATLPRRYHQNSSSGSFLIEPAAKQHREKNKIHSYRESSSNNTTLPKQTAAAQTSDYNLSPFDSKYEPQMQTRQQELPQFKPQTQQQPQQQQKHQQPSYSSRTLPGDYNQQAKKAEHQLLQSHYKGGNKNQFNTIGGSRQTSTTPTPAAPTSTIDNDNMRPPIYSNSNKNINNSCGPNSNYNTGAKSPINDKLEQHPQLGNTISSLPSANEVVRSALSRSNSPLSINQLNKTINLLPTSPPPYAPSPMTPTQNLKAATPSLTPSPAPYQRQNSDFGSGYNKPAQTNQYSRTLGHQDRSIQQPVVLHGTRTIERAPQQQQQQPYPQQRQQQVQQSVYANPHASLMQHRIDQQMKQPARNNNASIREFNELDSLLRSLSPGVTTHVTPGYTNRPSQPSFGYGMNPAQPQAQTGASNPRSDIYARVQKQPVVQATGNQSAKPTNYLQQNFGANQLNNNNINTNLTSQPYTIDVTNKKDDNCLKHEELSEFEPPIELLPSMEDYQNISKLNPVKNHYWYKPNMSRDRAINLLKDKPQGTFIVRDSTSFKGAYGLAVKVAKLPKNVLNNANLRNPYGDPSSELIRHFLIEPTGNGVRLKGYANESVYSNLANLIYQHSLTEIALPCRLVIPRADIEDPNFNYKQKQFYDEFVVSKEQAKHNPYEQTSPYGGYRKYPGDVYVHNEHRIIFE